MTTKIEILLITFFVVTMGVLVFSGLPFGFVTKPFLYAGIGFAAGYGVAKVGKKDAKKT